MGYPLTNIVMPVFNRHDETITSILSIRRMTGQSPCLPLSTTAVPKLCAMT
ncbi:MAG: hypothetical protein LBV80_10045 [Deltaproteobacteria bacterium]|nr:hypothetical protein [Deltaproteobacteria bacterium]